MCDRGWLMDLLLVVVTMLAYQAVWRAGFIWDDETFLLNNPLIKQADGLYRFWCTTAAQDYFPLTSTTLWVEWRLWGRNPLGYHLVNVLLHALSALLWWRILKRLKIPGAWLAAAVFAVHPVNVESVAWITERKNTLAMVFYALTLLEYVRFEDTGQRRWYWGALVAFVLALLSKTAVAPLPLVLLGLAWWRRGQVERRDVMRSIPFFIAAAVLAVTTVWFQSHRAIGSEIVRADNFLSRLAGAGWAIWFYLYKAVLPVNLMFVYPRWRIDGTTVLSYVPGLLVVLVLVACWLYRRGWAKAVLFGLAYYVVLLLPVLGFVDIYFMRFSLVADHWQYFAMVGPIGLAAAGLTTALAGFREGKPWLGPAVVGVLLVVLGVLTWQQCGMYADNETLWQTTLVGNQACSLAHNNLGYGLLQQGRVDEAVTHFQKAVEIQPGFAEAHYNLSLALLRKGQVDEAIVHCQRTLEIQPDDAAAHNNLGNALFLKGRVDEAVIHFQKASELEPRLADAQFNLGTLLLQKGRVEEAAAHFQKAVEIEPGFAEAHCNLGLALIQRGQLDEAMAQFQQASEIRPDYAQAHNNLGTVLLHKGRTDEAINQFQKALETQPNYAQAHYNLGNALLQKGRPEEAATHFKRALEIEPRNNAVENDLAWLLATSAKASVRNGARAIELAEEADQLSGGGNPVLLRTLAAAYAEAGHFAEAIATVQRAIPLATVQTNTVLVNALQAHLKLYQTGLPLRDTAQSVAPASTSEPGPAR